MNKRVELSTQLRNQLTRYFGPVYPEYSAQRLGARIIPDSIIRYGRLRLAGDGDRMQTADLIARDPLARDNSYVRVSFSASRLLYARVCNPFYFRLPV